MVVSEITLGALWFSSQSIVGGDVTSATEETERTVHCTLSPDCDVSLYFTSRSPYSR